MKLIMGLSKDNCKRNGNKSRNTIPSIDMNRKKEYVNVLQGNSIRPLLIPSKEPNQYATILDKDHFANIKEKAKVLTKKEKLHLIENAERAKNRIIEESQRRRESFKKLENLRQMGSKLTDLEKDAQTRANHTMKRAFELRQENEDEIQKANSLILSTKCQAIRDRQVKEKLLVKKELHEEDIRLDQMMEQARQQGLQAEKEEKERKHDRTQDFVKQILGQIKENELRRVLDSESQAEESRMINEALMIVQLEELAAVKQKAADQALMREKLNEVNKQLLLCKEQEMEEERVMDLRIKHYMEKKAERERVWEEEQNEIKATKEREIARLRALQERQQDQQAQADELAATRAADEAERNWRRAELEKARKKAEEEEKLALAREAQVEDRQRMLAMEITREQREFERILSKLRKETEEEKIKEMARKQAQLDFKIGITKQIQEKEREEIRRRKEQFNEIEKVKLAEEERLNNIKQTMKRKVQELRNYNVPENYVKGVERQLKLNEDENDCKIKK